MSGSLRRRAADPGRARHEPTRARAASAGRARRPSAAHDGAERRADRAAGGLRQCVHTPCAAAASPDEPASQAIARGQEPSHARVSAVRFTPPARTAWHTHAAGQTLYLTEGHGLHQPRGGKIKEIHAGDIICTPAGERHWPGAAPGHFMTHLPITEAVPGDERQGRPPGGPRPACLTADQARKDAGRL
jgi:quercetin dioxygenase-like cupin family protein